MAVYVDPAVFPWHGARWCHLTADSEDELHAFARRLGLRRRWFHSRPSRPWADHYDLAEPTRREAVGLGAREITRREAAARLVAGREAVRGDGAGRE